MLSTPLSTIHRYFACKLISVNIFFKDDGMVFEVCGKLYGSKQGLQKHKTLELTEIY